MKNTTVEEYYVVKSQVGEGRWFEDETHYAFFEDVENSSWNTESEYVKVFKRKVTVEEEEVQ